MRALQALQAQVVDRHIELNGRKAGRHLLPRHPPVAEVNCRYVGKTQHCGHRIQVMMAVNDVRRHRQVGEIVDHGDGGSTQLISDCAQPSAISNWPMAPAQQCKGNVSYVKLGAGPLAERIIREQHTHGRYATP